MRGLVRGLVRGSSSGGVFGETFAGPRPLLPRSPTVLLEVVKTMLEGAMEGAMEGAVALRMAVGSIVGDPHLFTTGPPTPACIPPTPIPPASIALALTRPVLRTP